MDSLHEPDNTSSSNISDSNERPLSIATCRNNKGPIQASLLPHQQSSSMTTSQTLYIPIVSPPTPAPSPGPVTDAYHLHHQIQGTPFPPFSMMNTTNPASRRQFLTNVISACTSYELSFISQSIGHILKRDFLCSLPSELALHILSFIDEPKVLTRVSQVSKRWGTIVRDESVWRRMCEIHAFDDWDLEGDALTLQHGKRQRLHIKSKAALVGGMEDESINDIIDRSQMDQGDPTLDRISKRRTTHTKIIKHSQDISFSYRRHFRLSYIAHMNWRKGGTLLRSHRLPIVGPENGTVTSLALDSDLVVVGFANSKIQVFSARTGVLTRTLIGHELGVWGLCLVSSGGYRLADTDKTRVKRKKSRTTSGETVKKVQTTSGETAGGSKTPSKKRQKKRKGSNQDMCASTSQPSMRTLRTGVAGIDLRPNLDDRNGMHVMPSESLDFLISPAMRTALGLDTLTDEDSGGDSHHEDGCFGTHMKLEDSTERARKRDTATSEEEEEEDPPNIGAGQGRNPDKPSSMCFSSQGWGQPNSLIVSAGCDKVVRVWDAESGHCIYVLHGHTSTVRSLRVLHNRPIAVTGSRDTTLRVWDIQRGRCLRVLEGHHLSVRCLDVCGNRVVSGSYDNTCRLWDIDTGECIFVLEGHLHQIYCVAFDGVRIASGGLDTTVRIWDAETGECLALLQGHTALVCQLQFSPTILATGGSDGRVIIFSLDNFTALQRIAAHDSSIVSLQFDKNFLVTGGNDGRVKLFETETGNYVRELNEPGECVWKVAFVKYTCAIVCKRPGKTVVEIWSLLGGGGRKGRERQRNEDSTKGLC